MNPINRPRSAARFAGRLLVAAVLLFPLGAASPQPGSSADTARRELDPSIIREFSGTKAVTKPSRDAVMGFSLATRVTDVLVRGGQEVSKGDALLRGDDAEDVAMLDLQRLRADSDVPVKSAAKTKELAQMELERYEQLRVGGGGTQQELDRARLQRDKADLDHEASLQNRQQEQVGLRVRQARVEKFVLRAPFDGVIDTVMVDVGQSVSENDKVLRIVNVDAIWIDMPAPMNDAATLAAKRDDPAWVLLDVAGTARLVQGKVVEVAPAADPASRTRRIRIEVRNEKGQDRLIPGDSAWVRLTPPSEALTSKLAAKPG